MRKRKDKNKTKEPQVVKNPDKTQEEKTSEVSIFSPFEGLLLKYDKKEDTYLSWFFSTMQSDMDPIIKQSERFTPPVVTIKTIEAYRNESLTPDDYSDSLQKTKDIDRNALQEEDSEEVEIL